MKLLKNSIVYILVSVFSGALSFLLLPILTNFLSPSSFGTFELYRSTIAFLQGIMIFGTNTLIFGNFFKWSKDDLKIFIHNSILLFLIILFLFSFLILLLSSFSDYLFINYDFSTTIILIAFVTIFFQSVTSLQTTIFQIKGQSKKYAIFTAGFSFISFLITYVLVTHYNFDWEGPVYSILFASFIFFILTIWYLKKNEFKLVLPIVKLKMILFLGAPLIFTHVSGWIVEAVDKFMITSIIDSAANGNYSVNYKFGLIVLLIQVGVLRAWSAFFYKTINKNTYKDKVTIVKYTYALILFLFLITICIIFISKFLFNIFIVNEAYYFSFDIVVFVALAYFFDGLWKVFLSYLVNLNLTKHYSAILIFSSLVNLVLNYFLIQEYGIKGAAISTFISFFIGFILTLFAALHFNPMPWLYFIKKYEK
jgi:O-antigen/teichoic acid export membrane protein